MANDWPAHVKQAFKAGAAPKYTTLKRILAKRKKLVGKGGIKLVREKMTRGEQVVAFSTLLVVPEGEQVGKPLELDPFQIAFILAIFDSPDLVSDAYLSIARRNGKTFVIAVILLAYIVGPLARESQNATLSSAAMSRDQAALTYRHMIRMLDLSPQIHSSLYKDTPSSKKIVGTKHNVEYQALSSDAKTGHGRAIKVLILDEAGQIDAASTPFVEMLRSSQGSFEDPLFIVISTQAPSDAAYFSLLLDAAEREQTKGIISHVYCADKDCELLDRDQWKKANPGLGVFRSVEDLRKQMEQAEKIPTQASGAMNLLLNMRVSQSTLFMSPAVWKDNQRAPNRALLSNSAVSLDLGLDLSQRTDLTAAVASWRDPETGEISVETHSFAPQIGVEQRQIRDRVPYDLWAREGHLTLTPGSVVDYEWVAAYLANYYKGITIRSLNFDRYRIELFQEASKKTDLYAMIASWEAKGQGFVTMATLLDAFEAEAMEGNLRAGGQPLLNMAVSQAIAVSDSVGNRKLEKSKSTQRIDPLVAAVMGVFPNSDGQVNKTFDVASLIG